MSNTRQRLQAARNKAAKSAEKHGSDSRFSDWRYWYLKPARHPAGNWSGEKPANHSGRAFFVDDLDVMGWRRVGDAADILCEAGAWRGAEGCDWYADNYHDSVIKSAVLQLPARAGIPRYIPATYCTGWDGATCYPLDWYETAEEAARAAASYAESEAEESRECCAKDAAEQQIEEKRQEIHETNRQALQLIREIKAAGASFSPAICGALRDQLQGMLRDRRQAFERIEELQADVWSAVPKY